MTPLATGLWIGNVVLNAAGQIAFKSVAVADGGSAGWRAMARSGLLWAGVACFAVEFVAWFALLSLIPLSQAMLIASINIVVVMIAGRVLFRDKLDATRVVAMLLIAAGVALAGGTP